MSREEYILSVSGYEEWLRSLENEAYYDRMADEMFAIEAGRCDMINSAIEHELELMGAWG